MSDIVDQAQIAEDQALAQSLRAHAVAAALTVRPKSKGHCLNQDCQEPFDNPERLFCGPPCAQRFETLSKLKR